MNFTLEVNKEQVFVIIISGYIVKIFLVVYCFSTKDTDGLIYNCNPLLFLVSVAKEMQTRNWRYLLYNSEAVITKQTKP